MSDIPIFDSLDFYAYPDKQKSRYHNLITNFKKNFDASPDFIARSPGRVNLVGEHIDYSFFGVLPLALEVDIIFAVKVIDKPVVQLMNTDETFDVKELDIAQDGSLFEISLQGSPDWSDYFKCGVIVAQKFMKEELNQSGPIKGLQILVDGQVPTGSGLSSSAAFICATTLTILKTNCDEKYVTKDNLVKLCTVSERYVGVNTGGMDQTASICGIKDHALFINFRPKITATALKFPKAEEPFEFLIANSLVVSNKAVTAPRNYNLRVVEVNTAAEVLAKRYKLSIPQDSGFESGSLKSFMDTYFQSTDVTITKLKKMLELVEETFSDLKEFTTEEAATAIGISTEEYTRRYLTKNKVIFDRLQLYKRSYHVFNEALRVLSAKELLETQPEQVYEQFGKIMNESQASCRDSYQCSCDEINSLCEIALQNGSYGSRVTGAGWGGCTVHLVPASKVEKVKQALIENYYNKKFPDMSASKLDEAIVISRPAWGSSLCVSNFDDF